MNFWSDLRQAARLLGRNPGFTAVTVLTLALGIGVNTAIFSLVNAVLLRPLPFENPEQLVRVWEEFSSEPLKKFPSSEIEYEYFRNRNQVFQEMAGYSFVRLNLTGLARPEQIQAAAVSPSLFPLLGVQPARGRAFLSEEDQPGRHRVLLVSDATWRHRFGSDPQLVGRKLVINDEPFTVVGIMPPGFRFPSRPEPDGNVEIWVPDVIDRSDPATDAWGSRGRYLEVIARRKPGVSVEQAQSGMDVIAKQFSTLYAHSFTDKVLGVKAVPMLDAEVQEIRPALLILLQAGGLVLLITCANISNLLLIHLQRRRKELSLRAAIGASRFQIAQRSVIDGLLLATIGGALGVLLSAWGVPALAALAPPGIPRIDEASVDLRVLGFALALSLLTGMVTALIPALRIPRLSSLEDLKEVAGRTTAGAGGHRFRNLLVMAEIALALVVLITAGLLIKDFRHLQKIDPGFDAKNVLTMRISLPDAKYQEGHQVIGFYRQLLERVAALPGVRAAGIVSHLPLGGTNSSHGILIEGRLIDPDQAYEVDFRTATPGYFDAMGIRLVGGRSFTEHDDAEAPGAVIIDERLAQHFWPGENPVGKRLKRPDPDDPWLNVIGVVQHVKHEGVNMESEREQIYYSYFQQRKRTMSLIVRSAGVDPMQLAGPVRQEVLALDRDQPVGSVQTMEHVLAESLAKPRFSMLLLSVFAALALVLAVSGTYGVIAASTLERTQEIGIRMALGARAQDVLRMLLVQSMSLGAIGVGCGLIGAFFATRTLASQLYGVSTTDPVTFAGVSLLLVGVTLAATYVPARRATRVDPVIALKH